MMIKTDREDFCKDSTTGALININKKAYERYKAQKANTERVLKLENDVSEIKSDLSEIKGLLEALIKSR